MAGSTGLALPEGRRGQILACGLGVAVLAVVWWGAAEPLIGWYGARGDWLTQRGALEQRMAGLAATLPELRRQVAAAPSDHDIRPDTLLPGGSDATAAAGLQQHVQEMAAHSGVTLAAVETLPTRPAGALRRIALHVTAIAPWPPLVHLLAAIEQADPRMSIDDMQLHTGANLTHPDGVPISASFSVIAFRAGDAP